MEEKILAMWLAAATGYGSPCGKMLVERFGKFSEIYELGRDDYIEAGVKEGSVQLERLLDKNTDICEKNYNFCNFNYFGIIEYNDALYPRRLRAIKNPPMVIYTRGRMIDLDDNVCIAVVGTRSYSDAGWNSTYKIASGLVKCGAVVVTGLASGIDTAATRAALDNGGFAVGVLGSGIERVYPSENTKLFGEMYNKGLVVTELPPMSEISGAYFPVRNRIISGLCQGVLVGEGAERSGAMITASHAAEQGKRIFAIPGDISNPESAGVNKLIREGAVPTFEAWDVLEKYAYMYPHRISNSSSVMDIDVPEERSGKKVRLFTKKHQNNLGNNDPEKVARKISQKKTGKEHKIIKITAEQELKKLLDETEYPIAKTVSQAEIDLLGENEKKVYLALGDSTPKSADDIATALGMDMSEVSVALTMLEFSGLVKGEGGRFTKN